MTDERAMNSPVYVSKSYAMGGAQPSAKALGSAALVEIVALLEPSERYILGYVRCVIHYTFTWNASL